MLASGCATSVQKRKYISGVYRWGNDKDNAYYLTLKSDGSYNLLSRLTYAAEFIVNPFDVNRSYGRWSVRDSRITLEPRFEAGLFPRVLLIFDDGDGYKLKPQYGAGWLLERGFLRISKTVSDDTV